ncbi:hypothetical protein LX36DRAFT_318003 [Colletotrichum falcatum]|nr:hypothetical protein LX36DRAFT_318003 [Colletotrichum falcatum]
MQHRYWFLCSNTATAALARGYMKPDVDQSSQEDQCKVPTLGVPAGGLGCLSPIGCVGGAWRAFQRRARGWAAKQNNAAGGWRALWRCCGKRMMCQGSSETWAPPRPNKKPKEEGGEENEQRSTVDRRDGAYPGAGRETDLLRVRCWNCRSGVSFGEEQLERGGAKTPRRPRRIVQPNRTAWAKLADRRAELTW